MEQGIDIFFRVRGLSSCPSTRQQVVAICMRRMRQTLVKKLKERWKGRAISTLCVTSLPRTATVRYLVRPLFLLFLLSHVMQRCPVDVPIRAVPPIIKINIWRLHQLIPIRPGGPWLSLDTHPWRVRRGKRRLGPRRWRWQRRGFFRNQPRPLRLLFL